MAGWRAVRVAGRRERVSGQCTSSLSLSLSLSLSVCVHVSISLCA